jgi:hypothetical protein
MGGVVVGNWNGEKIAAAGTTLLFKPLINAEPDFNSTCSRPQGWRALV